MILTYIGTEGTVKDSINIEGTLDNPKLVVKGEFEDEDLGVYPSRFSIGDYCFMDNTKVLDLTTMTQIWNFSKVGTSTFKLNDSTQLSVSPLGNVRYRGSDDTFITGQFPSTNELLPEDNNNIRDWNTSHGWSLPITNILTDTVLIPNVATARKEEVTYKTKVYSPGTPGGVNVDEINQEVMDFWVKIDNDRYMKTLVTNTNLGNHVIIHQYFDDQSGMSMGYAPNTQFKEIKVRVKYNDFRSYDPNQPVDNFISTHNFFIEDLFDFGVITNSNKDGSVQVILSTVSTDPFELTLVAKVVFDRSLVANAFITNLSMYDNGLIVDI